MKLLPRDSKEDKATVASMAFTSRVVGERYEIWYIAQEAGEFGLHIWTCEKESGSDEPGSVAPSPPKPSTRRA